MVQHSGKIVGEMLIQWHCIMQTEVVVKNTFPSFSTCTVVVLQTSLCRGMFLCPGPTWVLHCGTQVLYKHWQVKMCGTQVQCRRWQVKLLFGTQVMYEALVGKIFCGTQVLCKHWQAKQSYAGFGG